MSLVVIIVGHATFDPALTPRYGTPLKQLFPDWIDHALLVEFSD